MNCQEFGSLVVDLVRGEVTDSGLGTRCWAHAAGCPACADLLLEHEKLTASLEALATDADRVPVPEKIEIALREAFRARAAHTGHRVARLAFAPRPPRPVGIASSRLAWAMAAAAVFLIVVAATVAKWRQRAEPVPISQIQTPVKSQPVSPATGPSAAANGTHASEPKQVSSSKKVSGKRAPGRKVNSKARPSIPARVNPNDADDVRLYPVAVRQRPVLG